MDDSRIAISRKALRRITVIQIGDKLTIGIIRDSLGRISSRCDLTIGIKVSRWHQDIVTKSSLIIGRDRRSCDDTKRVSYKLLPIGINRSHTITSGIRRGIGGSSSRGAKLHHSKKSIGATHNCAEGSAIGKESPIAIGIAAFIRGTRLEVRRGKQGGDK